MIPPELEAEIVRLHALEKWPPGTIARGLGIHHSVVTRVLSGEGKPRSKKTRPSMVEPYLPFLLETLQKYPRIPASRLYDMVKERGYPGRPDHFRTIVARYRPARSKEAYLRLRTLPAEQAQVDWGHFGRLQVGRASRPLMAFVMVLSYSRAIFLRFYLSQGLSNFLAGHQAAFDWYGGVTRVILYDNLRSAVLERVGRAVRFNPQFLDFVKYFRYEPRPVAVGRGNEKGRVERAISFVRKRFFPARRFRDLADLNQQALRWCESVSLERRWPEDSRQSVSEVFLSERKKLLELPENPYPCEERLEVNVGKTPYVRFDRNDYSVPHTCARKTVVLFADIDTVRLVDEGEVIATHPRSYDRQQQIEDPAHIQELAAWKAAAGKERRVDRLRHLVPASEAFLEKVAEAGAPLGRASAQLLDMMYTYGRQALAEAIEEALRAGARGVESVRHILERARREAGRPPPRPLQLPDDPRLRELSVKPHALKSYDQISETKDEKEAGDGERQPA